MWRPAWFGPNANSADPGQRHCWRWTHQCQSCLTACKSHVMIFFKPCHLVSFGQLCVVSLPKMCQLGKKSRTWRSSTAGSCSSRTSVSSRHFEFPWRSRIKIQTAGSPTRRCPPKCSSGEWKLRIPWHCKALTWNMWIVEDFPKTPIQFLSSVLI